MKLCQFLGKQCPDNKKQKNPTTWPLEIPRGTPEAEHLSNATWAVCCPQAVVEIQIPSSSVSCRGFWELQSLNSWCVTGYPLPSWRPKANVHSLMGIIIGGKAMGFKIVMTMSKFPLVTRGKKKKKTFGHSYIQMRLGKDRWLTGHIEWVCFMPVSLHDCRCICALKWTKPTW